MKTLPFVLKKNDFTYIQLLRGSRSCIYRQEVAPDLIYFEVFIIKVKPPKEILGKIIMAREIFPSDEAFGYWAWSYKNYKDALRKFNQLEEEKNENQKCEDRLR